jgi:signal transduction histidine kinase
VKDNTPHTRGSSDPGTMAGLPGHGSLVVHLSFAVLLATSAVRYLLRHGMDAGGTFVAALSILLTLAYLATALRAGRRLPDSARIAVLIAIWAALVLTAPSFAWCAFPLFFICRGRLSGPAGYLGAAGVVVPAAVGLYLLADARDPAMLLGPLAAGTLLLLVYERIERDAAARQALLRQVAAAQAGVARLEHEAGIRAERDRLSRELHDTVTQGLTSSLLHLEAAEQFRADAAATRTNLERAAVLLRRNLAETRRLVHNLASPADDLSLAEAVSQIAHSYVPQAQVSVSGAVRPLPPETRNALLRITESAAANIMLHTHAATVRITLSFLPGAVSLDIYDDGTGFDPQRPVTGSETGGYGLRAMRQRAEQLGGVFSVESAPGEGTVVAAQLPAPVLNGAGSLDEARPGGAS